MGRSWSRAKQPVNRDCLEITLQIEREIRPLAFCSVILIIFISLVTIHFYRLVLNEMLGSFCFVFRRNGENYYDVSRSPRRAAVWQRR